MEGPTTAPTRRDPDEVGALALALLPMGVLLGLDPGGWYPFGPVKWLALVVLGGGGAALVLWHRGSDLPRPVGLVASALVAWLAVTAAVGRDPWFAWIGTPERRFGWVTWALCAALLAAGAARPRARVVVGGLVAAGAALGALTSLEALGWEPPTFAVASRLSATLGSPAYLGAAAALLGPLTLGVALDRGLGRPVRRVAAAAAAGLAVALVGSGARAAWLGVAVAGLALAWGRREALRAHRRRTLASVGVGLAALAAVAVLTPAGARAAALLDADAPGGRGRLDEWRVALVTAADRPLTGFGPEGYRTAFHEGVDDAYERRHGRDEQPDRAHSAPLDVLLVGGVPGLALWAGLLVLVGRRVLPALTSGTPWRTGAVAGLLAHVVGQLALFPLAEVEPLAWLLAGTLLADVPWGGASQPALAEPAPPRTSAAPARVQGRRLAVALVVLGSLLAVDAVSGVVADREAGSAARALRRGDTRAARVAAERASARRPDWPRTGLLEARAVVADGRGIHRGLEALVRARRWSPRDPVLVRAEIALLVDRALATGAPAHRDEAQRALDDRLAEDPRDGSLWAEALRLAEGTGDRAAAAQARARWEALTAEERRRG